jgi:Fe-Mn family superoxide dismutase
MTQPQTPISRTVSTAQVAQAQVARIEDQSIVLRRRAFLGAALAAPLAAAASKLAFDELLGHEARAAAPSGPHKLPPLPYSYSALNPTIDTLTMRTHHGKHHAKYVEELNKVVATLPQEMRAMSPQALLMNLNRVPEAARDKVRNNGGGHVNHSMFWQIMSPNGGGAPTGEAAQAIRNSFGSFEKFKTAFNDAGAKRFGSGWAWLVADRSGAMRVISTPNQDNPIMMGLFPILGNDVWEHAYYLKYKNKRPDYLKAWWNVVNWNEVNSRIRYMNTQWRRA